MTSSTLETMTKVDPKVDFPGYVHELISKGQHSNLYDNVDMTDDQIHTAGENDLNFMEVRTFWDRMSALDEIREHVTEEDINMARKLDEFHETAKRRLNGDRRPGDDAINGIDNTIGGDPKWLHDLGEYTLNRIYEVRDLLPQFRMLDKVRELNLTPQR